MQLKISKYDQDQGNIGPWYVEREDVVAFRTRGDSIRILLKGNHEIKVDDCPENMEFLLRRNQ